MVNQTSICELHHAKVHSFTNLHDFFQGSKVMLVMRTGASKHMLFGDQRTIRARSGARLHVT